MNEGVKTVKKLLLAAIVAVTALVVAGPAVAALHPGVYDPGNTGVQSAQFTLARENQCEGGSPRFNIVTSTRLFFLGCNNVTPIINKNGTATYVFTAQTLHPGIEAPAGTIQSVSVMIDVRGTADLTKIKFNGVRQNPAGGHVDFAAACKNGGWKNFTNPMFENQGQCVSYLAHARNAARHDDNKPKGKKK